MGGNCGVFLSFNTRSHAMRSDTRLLAAGMRNYRSGRLAQAEGACREVLRRSPEQPDALQLLALVAADSGNPDLATALLARAIQQRGATAPLCISLGAVLRQRGDLAASDACFRQALIADANCADAHYQYGVNQMLENQVEAAVASFSAALRLNPQHASACARLANVLHVLKRPFDALKGYDAALGLDPRNPETRLQRARVLAELDRLEEAAAAYREVLPRCRRLADAYSELGAVLRSLGKHGEARHRYLEAIALDPEHAGAHWNLALLDLLTGNLAAGWRGYEWRFRQPGFTTPPPPLWDGTPLDGRTILLHAEQGFGDTIQFARYAAMVCARGGLVTLECRTELQELMARAAGVAAVALPGAANTEAVCHASLLSLPGIFGTTLETIPATVPYFDVDATQVEEWRTLLVSPPGWLKVGVAWAGSPGHANDRNRSLPPAVLAALAGVPHIAWYSLQHGVADIPPPLAALPRQLASFADTAALLLNLDLVISADTAVAHLAGALARPVWTMLPFAPDWRWLEEREDSPWYPTMRLFRQRSPGDWAETTGRIRRELETFAR
jgi:tetratricopeptide (TPR) repeat protein